MNLVQAAVFARPVLSHFHERSLAAFIKGMVEEVLGEGGKLTFDVPLDCRYHREVLGDQCVCQHLPSE